MTARSTNLATMNAAHRRRRRQTAQQARDRFGFTVLELMIVLLIMGILAATAGPTFLNSLHHHRLESAARRVKQDLEYLRDASRAKSATLECELVGTGYRFTDATILHLDRSAPYSVDLTAAPYQIDTANFGGLTAIAFDGYGNTTANSDVVITLGFKGNTRTVRVLATTSKVVLDP